MLRLTELKITNKEPLHISFCGGVKKGTYNPNDGSYEIETRKDKMGFISPIDNGTFLIHDEETINQIMSYFFRKCDRDKSPQSLWETNEGVGYKFLLKDYESVDEDYFDGIINTLFKMMKEENNINKEYVYNIEVAYPNSWEVKYDEYKTYQIINTVDGECWWFGKEPEDTYEKALKLKRQFEKENREKFRIRSN